MPEEASLPDMTHHRQGPYEPLVDILKSIDPYVGNLVADAAGTEAGHVETVTERDALAIEIRSRQAITVEEVTAYALTLEETKHLAGIRMYAEFGQAEAEAGGLPHFCPLDIEAQLKELDLWPDGV